MANAKEELPKLTLKQKRFLKYYLEDPSNAAEAARKAGYSPKSAKDQACQLLRHSKLLPYLELAAENGELETGMDEEDIYSMLNGMASINFFDYVDIHNGRAIVVKDLREVPYELGQYIRGMKETANGIELQFYDKQKALDMLLKAKGAYNHDQTIKAEHEIKLKPGDDEL